MTALDGNVIGGLLHEVFGRETTAAIGTCGSCGARRPVAESAVYLQAPGTVVRCRDCAALLMAIVRIRNFNCVDLTGLSDLAWYK